MYNETHIKQPESVVPIEVLNGPMTKGFISSPETTTIAS